MAKTRPQCPFLIAIENSWLSLAFSCTKCQTTTGDSSRLVDTDPSNLLSVSHMAVTLQDVENFIDYPAIRFWNTDQLCKWPVWVCQTTNSKDGLTWMTKPARGTWFGETLSQKSGRRMMSISRLHIVVSVAQICILSEVAGWVYLIRYQAKPPEQACSDLTIMHLGSHAIPMLCWSWDCWHHCSSRPKGQRWPGNWWSSRCRCTERLVSQPRCKALWRMRDGTGAVLHKVCWHICRCAFQREQNLWWLWEIS